MITHTQMIQFATKIAPLESVEAAAVDFSKADDDLSRYDNGN